MPQLARSGCPSYLNASAAAAFWLAASSASHCFGRSLLGSFAFDAACLFISACTLDSSAAKSDRNCAHRSRMWVGVVVVVVGME
eukprot:361532-Chlamydomonas_euryale.AAC.1